MYRNETFLQDLSRYQYVRLQDIPPHVLQRPRTVSCESSARSSLQLHFNHLLLENDAPTKSGLTPTGCCLDIQFFALVSEPFQRVVKLVSRDVAAFVLIQLFKELLEILFIEVFMAYFSAFE